MLKQNFTAQSYQDNTRRQFKIFSRKALKCTAQLIPQQGADKSCQADNNRGEHNRRMHEVNRCAGDQGINAGGNANHQQNPGSELFL